MGFYRYKQEGTVWAEYSVMSPEVDDCLRLRFGFLRKLTRLEYVGHRIVNGRAFAQRHCLDSEDAISSMINRLNRDFDWASNHGWAVRIVIGSHIEDDFGISLSLWVKQVDQPEQGWTILEQVVMKRFDGKCALWSYSDDSEEP